MKNFLQKCSAVTLGVFLMTSLSGIAHADDRKDRGNNWNNGRGNSQQQRWRNQDNRYWRNHEYGARRYWSRPQPRTVYAPPIVYYQEPYYQEPNFNLVFPLNIR